MEDAETNNQEVIEATQQLINDIIPRFAAELNAKYATVPLENFQLEEELHNHGINTRYLGKLYILPIYVCMLILGCRLSLSVSRGTKIAKRGYYCCDSKNLL
jgi:hypothetical protein